MRAGHNRLSVAKDGTQHDTTLGKNEEKLAYREQ